MNMSLPESGHAKITTGFLPSSKLQSLAALHPFTQQVDIIFPSSDVLEEVFSKLDTRFVTGQFELKEIYELFEAQLSSSIDIICLSTSDSDDRWCIDPRNILTLCVTKETYERLGLVGGKLPFKGCSEQYVVRMPLHDKSESISMKARRKRALEDWDRRRQQDGSGKWDIMYYSSSIDQGILNESVLHKVKAQIRKSPDINIPVLSLPARPPVQNEDDLEDWNEHMHALFEWVGMACLGAQRLEVNDRVDPYVAVYTPPSPSRIDTITHIRWKGFLSHTFLQSVINTALTSLVTSGSDLPSFVSITGHGYLTSPVSYIPADADKDSPMRVPRDDAEDTWSLILSTDCQGTQDDIGAKKGAYGSWAMIESVDKWDRRWG